LEAATEAWNKALETTETTSEKVAENLKVGLDAFGGIGRFIPADSPPWNPEDPLDPFGGSGPAIPEFGPWETGENDSGGGGGASRKVKELTVDIDTLTEAVRASRTEWEVFTDEAKKFAGENIITGAVDGFIDSVLLADQTFSEFAKNFLREIAKMIVQTILLQTLQSAFGLPGGGGPFSLIGSAKGNAFSGGSVVPFAKGAVVSAPQMFPMTGGNTGLMGEAGPEAIMPLSRNSQGQLGVAGPNITINNNAGVDVAVTRSDNEIIEIAVNRAVKETQSQFSQSMTTGQGSYARSMEQGYKSRRRAT
jgi:hypothetical protein